MHFTSAKLFRPYFRKEEKKEETNKRRLLLLCCWLSHLPLCVLCDLWHQLLEHIVRNKLRNRNARWWVFCNIFRLPSPRFLLCCHLSFSLSPLSSSLWWKCSYHASLSGESSSSFFLCCCCCSCVFWYLGPFFIHCANSVSRTKFIYK